MKFIKKYYIIVFGKVWKIFMDKIQLLVEFIRNIEIQQIVNLIVAIVAVIVILLVGPFVSYGILKIFLKKYDKEEIKNLNLYKALKTFFGFSGFFIASKILNLNEIQDDFCNKCFEVVIIWSIARIVAGAVEIREIPNNRFSKNFFTSVVSKIIRIVLYIISLYLTLKIFGYDIGGLATGIGLTGAVVALAAQDFIKQIISGISILTDEPFKIGDWVDIQDISGTVEDITIKSTKVRTIEDTIVTVPNDLVTSSNVINWGMIKKRVFETNLNLPLETEEATIEKLINRIKFILRYNEDIITDSIRVNLISIEDTNLSIEIYVETTITNFVGFKEFCNKINLTLLNILDTQGVKPAYQGQNVYLKKFEDTSIKNISHNLREEKKMAKPVKVIK